MKILQLGKYYPPDFGGIETVTADLVEGFQSRGVANDVLCFNKANRTVVERTKTTTIIRCGTVFTAQSMPVSLSLFVWLLKIVKNYDVVHVHLPNPLVCFYLFWIPARAKFVLHWHSDIVKQKVFRLLYGPFVRALIRRSAAVFAPTAAHVEASDFSRILRTKAVEVPLPINLKLLYSRGAGSFPASLDSGWCEGRFLFALGRLIPYKGFRFLIEAVRHLPGDVKLVLGGEGPLRSALERQVADSGLGDRVVLVGRLSFDEIVYLYRNCTAFCLPSIWKNEMFGLVQVEAMAYGKPVVSTRIPGSGVALVNQHERTGLVAPPQDALALAKALTQAIEDIELQQRCQKESPQYVKDRFGMDAVVGRILATYSSVLGA